MNKELKTNNWDSLVDDNSKASLVKSNTPKALLFITNTSSACVFKSASFWQAQKKRNTISAKYLGISRRLDSRKDINLGYINIKNTNDFQQEKLT